MSRPKKVKEVEEALEMLAQEVASLDQAHPPAVSEHQQGPPLLLGQELEGQCLSIAFGGYGVLRPHNFVVFVPLTIDGETVRFRVVQLKRRYGFGELIEVLEPSPHRVEPLCKYFGVCGGCQYQHIAYHHQLAIKQKQVVDLIARIARIGSAAVEPILPCPRPYHYRNRIMVRTQWSHTDKRMLVGYLMRNSRKVIDIDRCVIAQEELNEQLLQVRKNPPQQSGFKIVLRVLPKDWIVPRDSFFQNNFYMLEALSHAVKERVMSAGTSYLIDVYCGVGFFAIELAHTVERYAGIEIDLQAIRAAQENAQRRQALNGEFVNGSAEELLPKFMTKFDPTKTTVILDPPRVGCSPEIIAILMETKPKQIIYISCHPATLARDIKRLTEHGLYSLQSVTPLDMFPQTQHIECVTDLRLSI